LHKQSEVLPLGFLAENHVEDYLAVRFSVGSQDRIPLQGLARAIHQRTEGNPLFMVTVVDDLIRRGGLVEVEGNWKHTTREETLEFEVPETVRQMILRQFDHLLPVEQRVLEVASVAGAAFSTAAIAAGLEGDITEVESFCSRLVQQGRFLRAHGVSEWPDGTVAEHYGFLHALYQEVIYERLPAGRRIQCHKRIGEREEAAYGGRATEIAGELALHFYRGRDYQRAVQYFAQAGKNAVRRSAHVEAIAHFTKGLELLKALPDAPERAQQELALQIALGSSLQATKGYSAPEVGNAFARAREICQQVEGTPQLFTVVRGLGGFYSLRAELQTARELGKQLLTLAQSMEDTGFLVVAYMSLGGNSLWLGEFSSAQEYFEQGITLYDPQMHNPHIVGAVQDPGVVCRSLEAVVLWVLGYPDQAGKRCHEALSQAQHLSHPHSLAQALPFVASIHQFRGEVQAVQERAEEAIALASEQGFPLPLAMGRIRQGWALAEQGRAEEGIAQIQGGISTYEEIGAELGRPHNLALLAKAYGRAGQIQKGLSLLAEALEAAEKTGDRWYEAELYRLRGELTLAQSRVQSLGSRVQKSQKSKGKRQKQLSVVSSQLLVPSPQHLTPSTQEAEACFLKAIAIARQQQAKSWELRATLSLAKLWQQQGKRHEARNTLAEIYSWFTEGFETADLREVKALIEGLSD
jgi:predicted ATPase